MKSRSYAGAATEADGCSFASHAITPRRREGPVAVAIGGFLCAAPTQRGYSFWRVPTEALEEQGFRVVTVNPSPVGSLHDRACQIFYQLKGGTVCYGEEHARCHGHACHGEAREGVFPEWDEDNPVHLIGHSYGGQTARVLQHLVSTGFFSRPGEYHTNASWVRTTSTLDRLARDRICYLESTCALKSPSNKLNSLLEAWVVPERVTSPTTHCREGWKLRISPPSLIPRVFRTPCYLRSVTACNSPLNGSLLVYSLGEKAETAPAVRCGSHGHILSVVIHVLELLNWTFLKRIFDPRLSHFELSRQHLGLREALSQVFRAAVGDSTIFAREDNAAFDMTVHSASRLNKEIETDPNTYYFSVIGTRPDTRNQNDASQSPFEEEQVETASGLFGGRGGAWLAFCRQGFKTRLVYWMLERLHSWQVRAHEGVVESLFGVAAGSWSASGHDGVLEAFTQSHPRVPLEREAAASVGLPERRSTLRPGVWHTIAVPADHMWMHVEYADARRVFERLARTIRLVADDPARRIAVGGNMRPVTRSCSRLVESPTRPSSRQANLRRSPRLLAKARARSAHSVGQSGVALQSSFAEVRPRCAACNSRGGDASRYGHGDIVDDEWGVDGLPPDRLVVSKTGIFWMVCRTLLWFALLVLVGFVVWLMLLGVAGGVRSGFSGLRSVM